MSSSIKNGYLQSETIKEILIYIALLLIIVLTSININGYLSPRKVYPDLSRVNVLGAETQATKNSFWQNFLSKNPDYIPGWIEMGRIDKVTQIDPNYF